MSMNMRYGSYPPPVAQGYSFAPPVIHQAQAMDPHTFRQFYAARLAELTFNSRPIIQNLSFIAQEYSRMAHVVAQCLEAHIRVVPPPVKLPALYLLDAIAKNVPNPYSSVLAEHVPRIFFDAYEAVDASTKSKMEEMVWTWRTSSPTGRELFGIVPQRNVENFIKSRHSASLAHNASPERLQPATPRMITKGQVLAEIDVIIAQKEQALSVAYDNVVANQLSTLKQLHSVVRNTDISQTELAAILSQLRSLSQVSASSFVPLPTSAATSSPLNTAIIAQSSSVSPPNIIPGDVRAFLSHLAPATAAVKSEPPRTSTPSELSGTNLTTLLGTLVHSGLVSASFTPSSRTPTGTSLPAQSEDKIAADVDVAILEKYESDIMKLNVPSSSNDIWKKSTPLVPFIYERQNLQCKQCSVRFTNGSNGKQKMDDHLDMHFRQNSHSAQVGGRGYGRSWFMGLESWQQDNKDKRIKGTSDAIKSAQERESELKRAFVVVQPGDEAKTISCPICKETLKPEFMEDDEEWVWRNAVDVNGKMFHATCHADAAAGTSTLLTRIKQQAGSRSRSATPELSTPMEHKSSVRLAEYTHGSTKRKALEFDNDDDLSSSAREGTPPSKKIAISDDHRGHDV